MNNRNNILIGIPSGELFNCSVDDMYNLYSLGLVKLLDWYKGKELNSYVFKDSSRNYVIKYLYSKIKIGVKIEHNTFGKGVIAGIISDGWIVHFNKDKKLYVNREMLIKDTRFKFVN